MTADQGFAAGLRTRFGAALRFFEQVDSTQQAAMAAAREGAEEGSLFAAEQQTAGRGRHGHQWSSPPGAGIYASLLLHPRRPAAKLPWLTLAAGLALADAVQAVCGLQSDLRWPNDLLLQGKKFCGILLECSGEGVDMAAALGFGINVAGSALPAELSPTATALDQHTAAPCRRDRLCIAAVEALLRRYAAWQQGDDAALRRDWERRSGYARGLRVRVGGSWEGVTEGLDEEGFLRVRTATGELRTVVSGEVRPAAAS